MSTRGAYGFRIDGADKVTYNHFDSYPEGLGEDIVRFIRSTPYEEMVRAARSIVLVSETDKPTPEQFNHCREYFLRCHGTPLPDPSWDWYNVLRSVQGDLFAYLNGLCYMIDDHDFLRDSLLCEWAYIINLDSRTFEVYRGFQKRRDSNPRNRYRFLPSHSTGYYPVALIAEYLLDAIPDDWAAQIYLFSEVA